MQELERLSSAEPRQRLAPGTLLGERYELLRAVAAGGFGAVYEARHVHTGRRVAVKVLHAWLAHDDDTRERFRRELQAPAQIDHPGIVDVIDADVDPEGAPFLVMEWLEGQTLRERMREGPFSLTELRDVFAPLLSALEAAHQAGFVHRDLKPENCIIARGPDGVERPRIVDFGLARRTGARTVTVTGTSLGTPRYMSPEQFMDSKTVGSASDVWAVGVMLYEALTGEAPFDASSSHAMMLRILTEPHVPVQVRLPGCPPRLATLIDRCLDKEPGERPSDARAVRSLFLGAYAAISGGMALRTIPEMPQSNPGLVAPKEDRSEVATVAPAHRQAPSAPAQPAPTPLVAAAPVPPAPQRQQVLAAAPRPTPVRETAPIVPPTSEGLGTPVLVAGVALVGIVLLVTLGLAGWLFLDLGGEVDMRPARPLGSPEPSSTVSPTAEPVPGVEAMVPDSNDAEARDGEDDEEGDQDDPQAEPDAPADRTERPTEDGPLHPLTRPLDRLLFE